MSAPRRTASNARHSSRSHVELSKSHRNETVIASLRRKKKKALTIFVHPRNVHSEVCVSTMHVYYCSGGCSFVPCSLRLLKSLKNELFRNSCRRFIINTTPFGRNARVQVWRLFFSFSLFFFFFISISLIWQRIISHC